MKTIAVLVMVSLLSGCSSEVDKCVEAQIKARGKLDDLALKHGALNVKTKEETEADARIECLRVAKIK